MPSRPISTWGKVAFYLLFPLAFLLIPTSWLEGRRSFCLIRTIFGRPCPGCGMTRAISCIFHGEFKQAVRYNKLVVIVFPLLCHIWVRGIMAALYQMPITPHHPMYT